MSVILLFIGLLITISFIAVGFYLLFMAERTKNLVLQGKMNPFKRKAFLTGNEKKLYSILLANPLLQNYHLYPQIHLSTFLAVKDEAYDLVGKFEWLNRLYVDFVIFDKEKVAPQLVIELNDTTHNWNSRQARDEFVKKALEENNIPLITVTTTDLVNKDKIISNINTALTR